MLSLSPLPSLFPFPLLAIDLYLAPWQIKSLPSSLLSTLADQETTTANDTNGISPPSIIHVPTPLYLDELLPTNN